MKQKLESIISKGKIIALVGLTFLASNCQFSKQDVEPEVLGYVVTNQLFAPNCDISSILPCGIKWSGSDGYGRTCSGVGTWCPEGEYCIGNDMVD